MKSERVLHRAARPDKPAVPPEWIAYFAGLGLVLGGVMVLLGWLAKRLAVARILFGCLVSVIGGSFGLLGLVMLCLWAFTDHRVAYANANIMQLAPWAIVLFGYGIGVALGRPRATRRAGFLSFSAVALSLVGIAAKAIPGRGQDNWPFVLLCLPIWLGLWSGLRNRSGVPK